MPDQLPPQRGTEILSKLKAISALNAKMYGGKEGRIYTQPGISDKQTVMFIMEYPLREDKAMQQNYYSLYNIAKLPVVKYIADKQYKIQINLFSFSAEDKVVNCLNRALDDLATKLQLAALLKSSIILADAASLMSLKEYGSVTQQDDGSYTIHFPEKMSAELKNVAMKHMIAALEESRAGHIDIGSVGEVKLTPAASVDTMLSRLTHAQDYLEESLPIHVPVPLWQSKVEVKKHRAFAEAYLQNIFPHSTVTLKPEQNPTEILIKPRVNPFDSGIERVVQLLPDTPIHIKENNGDTEIHLPITPQALMLRVIGSNQSQDQEFIAQMASVSPANRY